MMVAIIDSLNNLASSNDGKEGEDDTDDKTEPGKLSKDDEPGWVMGTLSKTVLQCLERVREKQIKLDRLT